MFYSVKTLRDSYGIICFLQYRSLIHSVTEVMKTLTVVPFPVEKNALPLHPLGMAVLTSAKKGYGPVYMILF